MEEQLKIALIQSDIVWENPKQNRSLFREKINAITKPVNLIVLPEMFTTGFTMNAKAYAETMTETTVLWLQKLASDKNAAIIGSIIIEEKNNFYNRLLFVHPNGKIEHYDKRHTFTLAGEDKVYTAGSDKQIIEYKGFKICPLVCYDLRFPVWARNTEDYDVLIYVANWPKPRINAWDALLKARAIENMSYCIGVNRVGQDHLQNDYCGHSAIYDVLGNSISTIKPNKEQAEIVVLERKHINFYRNKLKFLDDRDLFTLK